MNKEPKKEQESRQPADPARLGRRDFFAGLGKWSKVVIAAAVGGALVGGSRKADAGRWLNRRLGGGAWANRGGWVNRGGAWINRRVGGGAWANRGIGGGTWANRRW